MKLLNSLKKLDNNYDFVVVGSGFTGATIARIFAEKYNKKVLVIEKRDHIAGNMYDYFDKNNILIQKYGIHTFHTNKTDVYSFIQRFSQMDEFILTCLAYIKKKYVPVPFNFTCIDTFWKKEDAINLKKRLKNEFKPLSRVSIFELLHSNKNEIAEFGKFLYENDYLPYTCKQWGRKPNEIDPSILKRVKVALSYDNHYFEDKFQCIPKYGFTKLFANMLSHKNIHVLLNTDFINIIEFKKGGIYFKNLRSKTPVLYTGALDRLFNYKFGLLPYRSLVFKSKTYNVNKQLPNCLVATPKHKKIVRKTEMKFITRIGPKNKTCVVSEFSYECRDKMEPYYPVISDKSIKLFNKYKKESLKYKNLFFAGRLADFKYYNMDDAIDNAFKNAKRIAAILKY